MIQIVKDNIDDIANIWSKSVKDYLNERLTGRNKARYKDSLDINHTFESRIEKYKEIFKDKTRNIAAINNQVKDDLWRRIEIFLNDDECFKGGKAFLKKWVRWQNLYLTNIEIKEVVKNIFISIYEGVSSSIAYEIFEKLNIRTCPYCNRHYTFTLYSDSNEFKTRPEFDHFYDKSTYPMLAVTFYNLVPSCKECNHGKRNKSCGVNPYFDKFESRFNISKPKDEIAGDTGDRKMNINEIFKISKEADFSIGFKMPDNIDVSEAEYKNIETLGIGPLYNMHKDYVMEIVEKASSYNEITRTGIIDTFQGVFHNETDIYNLIFGRYQSDALHCERPLSKLTADILHQLEI